MDEWICVSIWKDKMKWNVENDKGSMHAKVLNQSLISIWITHQVKFTSFSLSLSKKKRRKSKSGENQTRETKTTCCAIVFVLLFLSVLPWLLPVLLFHGVGWLFVFQLPLLLLLNPPPLLYALLCIQLSLLLLRLLLPLGWWTKKIQMKTMSNENYAGSGNLRWTQIKCLRLYSKEYCMQIIWMRVFFIYSFFSLSCIVIYSVFQHTN